MKEYDFTLKYRLGNPNEDAEKHLEALAESGCDDAVVGVGQNGRISLNFIREAESALEAVASAISDVQKAIPEAKLVEATPDYVGVTDIAELFGFSRQYMRKLIQTKGASFPEPVHEGKPSLWHLTDILGWFREHDSRDIQSELFEVSQINMQLNVYKSCMKASAALPKGFKFEANVPNALQGTLRFAARP
ncbi:MAG: DNA-binding protein [Nitrococcus mobilis]|nr:DNA-binding protein [Nitrococcus mobilis]